MAENEVLKSVLEKVKAQKVNFGFLERFDVDENFEVTKALEEIQQYRAIGTVKELRELKEKATAKKPVREDRWDIPLCPACGSAGLIEDYDYCSDCGQKIDHEV